MTKTCTKCRTDKPLTEYKPRKDAKDGLSHECNTCSKARRAKYHSDNAEIICAKTKQWKNENPGKKAASNKKWALENPGKEAKSKTEYVEKNRANINIKRMAYYQTNKGKAAEYAIRARTEHPEKFSTHVRNYRARKRDAEGAHTASDIGRLMVLQKGKCACCKTGIKDKYHVDHHMPLARGGSNWPNNLQLLCPTCNMQKSAKHPIDFMRQKGFLL